MNSAKSTTKTNTKQLRSIGHKLKPVVAVAQRGLNDSVCTEIERALNDHELIKVSIKCGTREERKNIIEQICDRCNAEVIQAIGHVALIYRRNPKPNPRLSNLLR